MTSGKKARATARDLSPGAQVRIDVAVAQHPELMERLSSWLWFTMPQQEAMLAREGGQPRVPFGWCGTCYAWRVLHQKRRAAKSEAVYCPTCMKRPEQHAWVPPGEAAARIALVPEVSPQNYRDILRFLLRAKPSILGTPFVEWRGQALPALVATAAERLMADGGAMVNDPVGTEVFPYQGIVLCPECGRLRRISLDSLCRGEGHFASGCCSRPELPVVWLPSEQAAALPDWAPPGPFRVERDVVTMTLPTLPRGHRDGVVGTRPTWQRATAPTDS